MRRLGTGLLVSLLTFGIGVAVTFVWIVPYFRPPAARQENAARTAPRISINCAGRDPVLRGRVQGRIETDKKPPWKMSATSLMGREDLSVVKFLNENEGWVGGSKAALYKTTDAGQTWRRLRLGVPPDTEVRSISFVNSSVGWVVVSRLISVFEKDGRDANSSWVLRTSDGGESWRTQYQDKALRIDRVQFVNEREGWAAGDRIVGYRYEGFIIHTTDGGETWADVSARAARSEAGNSGSVVNILAEEPGKALLLKFSGDFFATDDGGNSWRQVASLPDEPPQAFLGKIKITGENRMWAVGGADSIEGTWGTLARMDSDCSWTRHSIGGVYFGDAAFPTERDVFVCGAIPSLGRDKGFASSSRDGLILHSADGARSWTIVYRETQTAVVTSLAVADSNNVWAVGRAGRVIHLRPAPAGSAK